MTLLLAWTGQPCDNIAKIAVFDRLANRHMRGNMAEMKAGKAVLGLLRAEGVEYLFGVTGLTTNSMVTEFFGREDIKFIDARHEEGAALMAYGYAKAPGNR